MPQICRPMFIDFRNLRDIETYGRLLYYFHYSLYRLIKHGILKSLSRKKSYISLLFSPSLLKPMGIIMGEEAQKGAENSSKIGDKKQAKTKGNIEIKSLKHRDLKNRGDS